MIYKASSYQTDLTVEQQQISMKDCYYRHSSGIFMWNSLKYCEKSWSLIRNQNYK